MLTCLLNICVFSPKRRKQNESKIKPQHTAERSRFDLILPNHPFGQNAEYTFRSRHKAFAGSEFLARLW